MGKFVGQQILTFDETEPFNGRKDSPSDQPLIVNLIMVLIFTRPGPRQSSIICTSGQARFSLVGCGGGGQSLIFAIQSPSSSDVPVALD